jgi:hypothetical protein
MKTKVCEHQNAIGLIQVDEAHAIRWCGNCGSVRFDYPETKPGDWMAPKAIRGERK